MEKCLNNYNHIYFIGIGGISLSALAMLCLSEGISVSGSDRESNSITEHLSRLGIKIFVGHNAKNINNVDLVVYSSAISDDNEELVYAREKGIENMERAEFLGMVSSGYQKVIAIGGVHGKTTTTGMMASVFMQAGLNPTVHIGGESKNFGSNIKIGGKEYFITEACEYRESFLKLKPDTAIILNIEEDHPDYYKNLQMILNAFDNFALNSKNVVIGERYKSLISNKNVTTFSLSGNSNYYVTNIVCLKNGTAFSVIKNGKYYARVFIKLFGRHNVYNALSVIAVSEYYGISKKDIIDGLYNFNGIKRRFEYWGKKGKSVIFHDYAHHPTEIISTIKTAKEYFNKPIICFFQPHTYSRTKRLFSDFVSSFCMCEKIYILPTYPAREKSCDGYSGLYLAKNIIKKGDNCEYVKKFESASKIINSTSKDAVVLILGAGDIYKLKTLINFD